ncbi:MAG: TolC family protein [Candidatus Latescibacterota bacterium]|nr:TolC family protein [Candidatus Latescibacterota bacterium]
MAVTNSAPLTLAECLDLAYANNLSHLSDFQSLAHSREALHRARAPYELNANASLVAPSFTEERDTFENPALLTRFQEENTSFRYQGNVQLSRRVRNIGEFSITTFGFRSDFSSNRRQDVLEYLGDVRFGYEQDIFSDSEEDIQLKQAELSLAMDRSHYERQRLQLTSQVTNTYYDLVQSIRQLEIQEQRVEQSRVGLDLAQRKYEIGLLAEVEALRLEVEKLRSEADYAQTATEIESRRDILRQLVGLEMTVPLEVITEVHSDMREIDDSRAIEIALRRRTDMREVEIRKRVSELDVDITQQQVGPSAMFNASMSLRGRGEAPEDIGRNFERNLVTARIDMQFPLLDGGERSGLVRQAEINLEQSRLNQKQVRQTVIRDVREAVRSLREAERQIQLRQAALDVAQRTFEVERSRFELGLADSQQLLDAQTELTSERTDALNALITYPRALQDMQLATMADLSELAP